MKRMASFAGGTLALLSAAFFLHSLQAHWSGIRRIPFDGRTLASLGGAILLYCSTYLAGARSWQLVLRTLKTPLRYRSALRILATSQFAKYLPGNVAHHVGRVVLARRAGVAAEIAVASLALDTLLVVVAGALCALGAVGLLADTASRYGMVAGRNAVAALALAVVVTLSACLVPALRQPVRRALGRLAGWLAAGNRRTAGAALLQYVINFLLGAAALGVILLGLGSPLPRWSNLLGLYALAWVAGFAVPGAPAGLGVRESLLVLGLGPTLGTEVAVAATALFRLATVAGDGLAFGAGLLMGAGPSHAAQPEGRDG